MYCKYGSYMHPLSNSDTQLLKTGHTCTTCFFSLYVATFPKSLGNICNIEMCVRVLQTAAGEGVENHLSEVREEREREVRRAAITLSKAFKCDYNAKSWFENIKLQMDSACVKIFGSNTSTCQ